MVEPPEPGPAGKRVSPISTRMRSGAMPSSSATAMARTVRVPVPMSCTALLTTTAPSRWTFTITFHAPPADGVEITYTVKDPGSVSLWVCDGSDGLDGLPGFVPRPDDVSAAGSHSSDLVLVAATVPLA